MKFKANNIVKVNNPYSKYHSNIGKIIDFNRNLNVYIIDTKIAKICVNEKFLELIQN